MNRTESSNRVKEIEKRWGRSLANLFHHWHWNQNLKHREIGEKISVPRPTVTRWFRIFGIPTQPCTRFTNLNLLNTGPRKGPRATPKIRREFPWKFNKNFFEEWSSQMAYVLGFLFADGYVQRNSRGSSYFCFVSTNREIIEKIRNALMSNHKIGVRKKNKINPNWKDLYVLQIGSVKLFKDLEKFGIIRNKGLKITFPNIPSEFLGHFVRGYFDGDGNVWVGLTHKYDRKNPNKVLVVGFTSGSGRFLKSLMRLLKSLAGLKGGSFQHYSGAYRLHYSTTDSLKLYKFMYSSNNELCLDRKKIIFEKFLNNKAGVV